VENTGTTSLTGLRITLIIHVQYVVTIVHIRLPCSQNLYLRSSPTVAPKLVYLHTRNQCQVSVTKGDNSCFVSASVGNRSPARCSLKGSKEMATTGPHTVNRTCDWFTALWLGGHRPPNLSSNLTPSDFNLPGPVKKHLAGKQLGTNTNIKQSVTSKLQAIFSMSGYKPWCHSGIYA